MPNLLSLTARVFCVALLSLACVGVGANTTWHRVKTAGILQIGITAETRDTLSPSTQLVQSFAQQHNLDPRWRVYPDLDAARSALDRGEVDFLAHPQDRTLAQVQPYLFTLPLLHADLWVVANAEAEAKVPSALHLRTIGDAWHAGLQLRSQQQYRLRFVQKRLPVHEVLEKVAMGEAEATLAYDFELDSARQQDQLNSVKLVRSAVPLAWMLRSKDHLLANQLNDHLRASLLAEMPNFVSTADWDAILASKHLRLITLYGPSTFMLWENRRFGYEYELMRVFARKHGLQLDVRVAANEAELYEALRNGQADLAGGFLRPRELPQDVQSSEPVYYSQGVLVARKERFSRFNMADLHGNRIFANTNSPFLPTLNRWQEQGIGLRLHDDERSVGELLPVLNNGVTDLLLMHDYEYYTASASYPELHAVLRTAEDDARAMAIRAGNPELKRQLDIFLKSEMGSNRQTRIANRYFNTQLRGQKLLAALKAQSHTHRVFSPYDDLARRYARYYDFDWRLILAVMAQESAFDYKAVSYTGAKGLMQVQDVAARQVGITNMFEPQSAIHAGVKYLDWVRDQFDETLSVQDRTWFSLAAYNGGIRWIKEARVAATEQGLDPNRWFGGVEQALIQLKRSDPEGRFARLDVAQVTDYVRKVRAYYDSYARMTSAPKPQTQQLVQYSKAEQQRSARLTQASFVAANAAPGPQTP